MRSPLPSPSMKRSLWLPMTLAVADSSHGIESEETPVTLESDGLAAVTLTAPTQSLRRRTRRALPADPG